MLNSVVYLQFNTHRTQKLSIASAMSFTPINQTITINQIINKRANIITRASMFLNSFPLDNSQGWLHFFQQNES